MRKSKGDGNSIVPPIPPAPDRISKLEADLAQLRAEHDEIASVIRQAIMAQIQQAIAQAPPETQKAFLAELAAAGAGEAP